jgi:hypothetical protein
MNTNILIRWISVFLVGVGLFLTMLFSKGNYNLYGLVDAFFIPGGVLVCVGVLGWVAQNGQFDIFSYGFGSVFHRAFKYNEPLRDKDLPEYKERKEQERIYKGGFATLLPYFVIGGLFLIVTMIIFIIYKNV